MRIKGKRSKFLQARAEIPKTLISHEPRLVFKGSALVIETPPLGSVDDINQFKMLQDSPVAIAVSQ